MRSMKWNWLHVAALAVSLLALRDLHAADDVQMERDVDYSNPDNQHFPLNIASPRGEGPFPAVLCIHGGGFRAGTRDGYDALIKKLAEHGYVAATVTYRLAPKYQ